MKIAEIPFVMNIAEYVWGSNQEEDVTPEICVDSLPFLSKNCFMGLFVKALGVAVILGSFLNKAPVIINIMRSKSVGGLSLVTFYGELLCYANSAFYGYLNDIPITAYGENIALSIQTIILIFMTWELKDDPPVPVTNRAIPVGIFAAYGYYVMTSLGSDYYYLLMASMIPILVIARGTQIIKTFQVKHTGSNSIITYTMNLGGSVIRILTTIKEVGWDFNILNTYFISFSISAVMFLQYFLYIENTKIYLNNAKKAKIEKKDK